MRVAETTGEFNDATARKIYRNDSISIPGKNFDQGAADPTRGARNDDDASCLHDEDFSRAPFSDFSPSILSGKMMRRGEAARPGDGQLQIRKDDAAIQQRSNCRFGSRDCWEPAKGRSLPR